MKPIPLTKKLNEFLSEGLANDVFEAVNFHTLRDLGSVQKLGPDIDFPMMASGGVSAEEYVKVLEDNNYSAVFKDGSIIVIQVSFEGVRLHSHRYIYLPCPIDQQYISIRSPDIPLADWVRGVVDIEGTESVKSAGYIRFDCVRDLPPTDEPHPVSHMTFASGDCRVPVYRPLSISEFLNFVFDNFYRQSRNLWLDFAPHLNCDGTEETITIAEQGLHHIYCSEMG